MLAPSAVSDLIASAHYPGHEKPQDRSRCQRLTWIALYKFLNVAGHFFKIMVAHVVRCGLDFVGRGMRGARHTVGLAMQCRCSLVQGACGRLTRCIQLVRCFATEVSNTVPDICSFI